MGRAGDERARFGGLKLSFRYVHARAVHDEASPGHRIKSNLIAVEPERPAALMRTAKASIAPADHPEPRRAHPLFRLEELLPERDAGPARHGRPGELREVRGDVPE